MDYYNIPEPPKTVTAANILIRLIDGLAFRYRWATENLTPHNLAFKPCETSMNVIELLHHIHHLATVINKSLNNIEVEKTVVVFEFEALRFETLTLFKKSSKELMKWKDSDLESYKFKLKNKEVEFPVWNLINGPIADALTHVGQINSWRRIDGNPTDKVNVFTGCGLIVDK